MDATFDCTPIIAEELTLSARRVAAALALFEGGATVPFVARYRKEATGGLDEVQLRAIAERREYLLELEQRRKTIRDTIAEQGKLDDALRARLEACRTKAELEDLYLPYKPKRRTRAMIARERGLEPLAARIRTQAHAGDPVVDAQAFVDPAKEVPDVEAALGGARAIVAEELAEDPLLRKLTRTRTFEQGQICSSRAEGAGQTPTKFEQYYDYKEPLARVASHRYLALRRGEREKVLSTWIDVDREALERDLGGACGIDPRSPYAGQLTLALQDSIGRLLLPSIETDVRGELKDRAESEAIDVFASNLRNLLLAPPLGTAPVIAVDPGLRTGCKVAALDGTGRVLMTTTIQLLGDAQQTAAAATLLALVREHAPRVIAVGNGTGGRDAESFARRVLREAQLDVAVVPISEAGASVYSASELARDELPTLDVTLRGAVSIGRRLQDPLAELVKIDPKSIGVGQYQHDVNQTLLARKLDEVVESCVNGVGVELNTASPALLARVAGIGPTLATRIVAHREAHGPFATRRALREVSGIGPKTFEQAAGFLRVQSSSEPLDRSAVHPERYTLVERMARDLGVGLQALVGNSELARRIAIERYVCEEVGEPTLRDIVTELERPGRDPRASFEPPAFREDVQTIEDLRTGMELAGVVTNVTAFGAFVDVGVHQDGLVHISQLADRFVKDPHEVVRVGDRLTVRVLEVDTKRARISLTARREARPAVSSTASDSDKPRAESNERGKSKPQRTPQTQPARFTNNPFARLLDKK